MKDTYLNIIYTVGKIANYQTLYSTNKRNYNTDETYYENELHILSEIVKNKHITLIEIARLFYKTKSYISQVISGLEAKQLVIKTRDNIDTRKCVYEVTEKGMAVYLAHEHYDLQQSGRMAEAFKDCSDQDMTVFLKMLKQYHAFQLADTNALTKGKK